MLSLELAAAIPKNIACLLYWPESNFKKCEWTTFLSTLCRFWRQIETFNGVEKWQLVSEEKFSPARYLLRSNEIQLQKYQKLKLMFFAPFGRWNLNRHTLTIFHKKTKTKVRLNFLCSKKKEFFKICENGAT